MKTELLILDNKAMLEVDGKQTDYNVDLSAIQEGKTISELVGVWDVEKLAYDECWNSSLDSTNEIGSEFINGYTKGFTKRSELTKEKIYTEDDMFYAYQIGDMTNSPSSRSQKERFDELIQSLHRFECEEERERVKSLTGDAIVLTPQPKIYPNNTVKILKVKI